MDYEQLIEKINEYITTNGSNEITGAKLNEVLRDIVNTVAESVIPVQVILSDNEKQCLFRWPYDDTDLEDVVFDGYNGGVSPAQKFPLNGTIIMDAATFAASSYSAGVWVGNIQKLEKGKWYVIGYQGITSNTNCIIYLGRQQSN